MSYIIDQLNSLLTFLDSLKDLIFDYFRDIGNLVFALRQGIVLLATSINLLPPFITVFATLTVTALMLLQLIGRSNSGG